ncbi:MULTISPECIES: hypothetical protein [unclassified Flavobacterium]|uniref:hypothetical protein n=1 Tax=unclassified Flavobacterium TaxID=196869 RepID=UPI003F8EB014
MKKIKYLLVILFALNGIMCLAQETINAYDPNTFLFGGGQGSNFAVLDLQTIAIIDAEPDPSNSISFGISTSNMEAGLPVTGAGGNSINEDTWLNFTYRALNYANARIFVYTNQAVPAGMAIKIQIIARANVGGVYNANPNTNPITLSNFEQVLVYDFASGYTGDGLGTGYQVRCTIENPNGVSLSTGFEIIYEIK